MNSRTKDILKLARAQLVVLPIFFFFKLVRPNVLDSNAHQIFKTILLSLPNFFEGIIGTLTLTGLGLIINDKMKDRIQLKPSSIYMLAVVLAGIYVFTQELKIHNLGGNNVYDSNDLVFSFIGLIIGYCITLKIKPEIRKNSPQE